MNGFSEHIVGKNKVNSFKIEVQNPINIWNKPFEATSNGIFSQF